jgi:hypothetical protein
LLTVWLCSPLKSCPFAIGDGVIIEGSLPNLKRKLVEAWIEIHRDDLIADWELAVIQDSKTINHLQRR